MVDLTVGGAYEAAAGRVKGLEDYDARLERAARRVDGLTQAHETAAMVIYESALMKSRRPRGEVRGLVLEFEETFEDEEEPLTIPRTSGIMNVEGDEWFFGSAELRALTGQLLGQFQHRVAQYNYVTEREVLRRWADGHDLRLFIRRRIYETEPVAGVVPGLDLRLMQYLRVAAGGDTVVPDEALGRVLAALGVLDDGGDDYAVLAAAENLALRLELPAPIVGEMLRDLAAEDRLDFAEPPSGEAAVEEAGVGEPPGDESGRGGTDQGAVEPSPEDRASREAAQEEADRGEEPTRVQDPQAKDAPGVREEEGGERPTPAPPRSGAEDAPSTGDEGP